MVKFAEPYDIPALISTAVLELNDVMPMRRWLRADKAGPLFEAKRGRALAEIAFSRCRDSDIGILQKQRTASGIFLRPFPKLLQQVAMSLHEHPSGC